MFHYRLNAEFEFCVLICILKSKTMCDLKPNPNIKSQTKAKGKIIDYKLVQEIPRPQAAGRKYG